MSDNNKDLPESIKSLTEELEEKNAKISFGLEQQGHIKTIEDYLAKWDNPNMLYNTQVWNDIGKKIGWCPLTAALYYFRYLENKK